LKGDAFKGLGFFSIDDITPKQVIATIVLPLWTLEFDLYKIKSKNA